MMKNKKGFTLIELLVCITILGIIMGMSIPVIRNITVKNSNTKYSAYLDVVEHAARLYVDTYAYDMFGHYESGCAYVTIEDLLEKKLLKDFNSDGITCNTTSTYVEVTKFEGNYSFKSFLGCANKDTPNQLIYTLPVNGEANFQDPATCAGIDTEATIGLTVTPNSSNDKTKKSEDVKIRISGRLGINPGSTVWYKWSKDNYSFNTYGMQEIAFTIPPEPVQRVDISAGRPIELESSYISTPIGESGKVYLIVYSANLGDFYGNEWSYNNSNYVAFGPYTIDNDSPRFDTSSAVVSGNGYYNNDTPRLSLSVTDDVARTEDIKMCVSYADFCSDWEDFSANKILPTIPNFEYNGSNYKVYVSLKDLAGNIAQKEFIYKSYKECTSQTDNGSWTGDCPPCGTNVVIQQTKARKDSYLGTSCDSMIREYTCSIPSCCSKTTTVCGDYGEYSACSRPCGIGVKSRSRSCSIVSAIDGSDCGTVDDSSQLIETVECNTQACAPMLCQDPATNYNYHNCNTFDKYVTSRSCSVGFLPGYSTICIDYVAGKKEDNVEPTVSCKIEGSTNNNYPNRDWFTNCKPALSLTASYNFTMRIDNGLNYMTKGGETVYGVNQR